MKHHELGFLVIFVSSLVILSTPAIHAEGGILATSTSGPNGIAFDGANNRMYVTNSTGDFVYVVDTIPTVSTPDEPITSDNAELESTQFQENLFQESPKKFSNGELVYSDPLYGFHIAYPKNWSVVNDVELMGGEIAAPVAFYSDKPDSTYPPVFTISYANVGPEYGKSLRYYPPEEVLDNFLQDLSADEINMKIIDSKIESYLDGFKISIETITTGKVDEKEFATLQKYSIFYFHESGDMYALNFFSSPSKYDTEVQKFLKSSETFHVGKIEFIEPTPEQVIPKCGTGTVFDETSQTCIAAPVVEPESEQVIPKCGTGTVFDETSQTCIAAPVVEPEPEQVIPKCGTGTVFDETSQICIAAPVVDPEPVAEPVKTQKNSGVKEFGDDYYVDEGFGFAIKIPENANIDTEAVTITDSRSLVAMNYGGDGEFTSRFGIHYIKEDPEKIYFEDLLFYYSEMPNDAGGEYTSQIKINNQHLEKESDRYKITYEYSSISSYPNDFFLTAMAGKTLSEHEKIVIFLYPNGDNYAIIFSSPSSAYSKDVKVFDSIIDTFYAGNVKQIKTTNIQNESSSEGGGCLIATATYGTELAPQVQLLRELRDNSLLQTKSGTSFMASFNQFYYSFSPTISDWERQSPLFKEIVKTTITPMLSTMSILNYANIDSEQQMLGYGIGVILMNIGMYFVAPAVVIHTIKKKI